MGRDSYSPQPTDSRPGQPFRDAEEAWFWFMLAQQARSEGARVVAGASLIARPCEPADILKVVERLYRQQVLVLDHLLVLRHYGRRMMPPDGRRTREVRAAALWREALKRMEAPLTEKGIITPPRWWRDLDPGVAPSCGFAMEACHVGAF